MNRLIGSAVLLFLVASCTITEPVSATSNPIGSKVGKSSGTCVLNICLDVDAGINSAAKNGGITKISTVDYRTKNYLGIIKKHECIVTGE